ncbi:MAG TPA: heme o synthase [Actinomycetota bacterium]|jgi:protoheme IX farnesyltransferase|nr:heme o synthase [Actinomycetota bacterium]
MKRTFRSLATTTAVLTLLLIAWGGIVRTTGSGDGCPDWPTCFGRWIPRAEYHTLIEYTHRLLAFLAGVASLALAAVGGWSLIKRGPVERLTAWLAVALLPLFIVQALIGGWIIHSGENPSVVTLHFAVAFIVLGLVVVIAARTRLDTGAGGDRSYARLTLITAAATYALLLVGTYVRAENAGLAFREWPLMGQSLVPDLSLPGAVAMFAHRMLAIVVVALVAWTMIRARTMTPRSPLLVRLSTAALILLILQVLVGGANVLTELATWARASHVAISALIWATVVALTVAARVEPSGDRSPDRETAPETEDVKPPTMGDTIRAYVALTKPRIIVLLLIITVPAMVLAAGAIPSLALILVTLIGGTLAAGAANAMNMYLDRDIDQVMRRTRQRPLPKHKIEPEAALRFGFVLAAIAYAFLAITVNVLAAALALSAIAFYVFVYTMWLKRSTDQNIVIGGAAGAVPVLVGWAAVTGSVAMPAIVLFSVVFLWTPPHFWALALRMRDDYAAAGVPMMPVVRGDDETRRQIFLYSLVLFGVTLVLIPIASMGPVYTATAVVLGGVFVYRCLQLWREPTDDQAWRVFKFSLLYLAGLFVAVALDALV